MNPINKKTDSEELNNFPGYPAYPESEDIYGNCLEERDIDPEDISKIKDFINVYKLDIKKGKEYNDDVSGNDLDIPGSELDDNMENIGSEDEENNYYSLGEDDLDDMEDHQEE